MGRASERRHAVYSIVIATCVVVAVLAVQPAPSPRPPAVAVAQETSADFPGPMPLSWGFVSGIREAPKGKDVRVNDPAERGALAGCHVQSETSLAAYESNVYVGFNDARDCLDSFGSASWTGFARSTDDGRTFDDLGPVPPGGPIRSLWGDPVIALDTHGRDAGTVFLASLADAKAGNSTLAVGRSEDDGKTFKWHDAIPEPVPGAFHDKEWLTIDNTGGRHDGSLYLVWTQFGGNGAGIRFVRSTDGAKTWSEPITLDRSSAQAARVAIGHDGELIAVWGRFSVFGMSYIIWARSHDGGRSFSKPKVVAEVRQAGHMQACPAPRQVLNGDIRVFEAPSVATDTFGSSDPSSDSFNPHYGTTYLAFNAGGEGSDESDVFLTELPRRGKDWTEPRRLNDDETSTDQFFPEVVTTGPGRLAITWTDRRVDPGPSPVNNRSMAQFIAFSKDGGKSVGPNRQLSDRPFPPPYTNPNSSPLVAPCYAGDYNGLYAAGRAVFASWGDNRDDLLVSGIDTPVVPDPNVYFRKVPAR